MDLDFTFLDHVQMHKAGFDNWHVLTFNATENFVRFLYTGYKTYCNECNYMFRLHTVE